MSFLEQGCSLSKECVRSREFNCCLVIVVPSVLGKCQQKIHEMESYAHSSLSAYLHFATNYGRTHLAGVPLVEGHGQGLPCQSSLVNFDLRVVDTAISRNGRATGQENGITWNQESGVDDFPHAVTFTCCRRFQTRLESSNCITRLSRFVEANRCICKLNE